MTMEESTYHLPVMLQECIEALNIQEGKTYLDLTFGGGGHSKEILKHIAGKGGLLVAFDQDSDAEKNAEALKSDDFVFIKANFRYLKKYLKLHGIGKIHGILADLGVSSYQIDTAHRGFSTRFDADLDMRMSQTAVKTAKDVLAKFTEKDLQRVFSEYGEVKNSKTLAKAIVDQRGGSPIDTVAQFKTLLDRFAPGRGGEFKYYAQVFQALRIEVNEELESLQEALAQCAEVLEPGGRIVIMSYHSLEDRIVKNYVNTGKFSGEADKDVYGNVLGKPFESLLRKPVTASDEELKNNKRARSAKLRVAVKL